jgi:hypothetical protein
VWIDDAVLVAYLEGLARADSAALGGLVPSGGGVVNPKGDVADAVAVLNDVFIHLMVGAQRGGENEADLVLLEDVTGAISEAGLGAGIGDELITEGGAVVVGRLAGVADVKLYVVGAVQGEEVGIFFDPLGLGVLAISRMMGNCCHGALDLYVFKMRRPGIGRTLYDIPGVAGLTRGVTRG